jgi:hypothetical protein
MTDQEQDPTQGHSPLPWGIWSPVLPEIHDADLEDIEPGPADAALIVREVNEAPKLRERVRELEAEIKNAFDDAWHMGYDAGMEDGAPIRHVVRSSAPTAEKAWVEYKENTDD